MKKNISKKCPVCSKRGEFIFESSNNHFVYNCLNKNCGHFWVPEYTKDQLLFEREENLENESNNRLRVWGKRNKKLLNLILKKISFKKEYKFLDFGSGCAHISRTFKRELGEKVKIFCIDSNKKCKKFYPKWGLIPIEDIKQIQEKIDFIYLIEVIEHLENPQNILCNLKGMLSDNGVILISTPPGYHNENYTNAYSEKTHIHFFTNRSLNVLLEKVGLKKIEFKYYPEFYPSVNYAKNFFLFSKNQIKNLITFKFSRKQFLATFYEYFLENRDYRIKMQNKLTYPYHLIGFTKIKSID